MAETWEPGTVGVATVRGEKNVLGMWVEQVSGAVALRCARPENLRMAAAAADVTDFRPFVVIDPETDHWNFRALTPNYAAESVRRGLRSMLPKPTPVKPEEPQRLLARVKLRDGRTAYRWTTRTALGSHFCWRMEHEPSHVRGYDDLDVVEILSEGIEP